MSVPPSTPRLSTRVPQSVLVITVIVCVLWVVIPQVQDLITSLIVLNALWLAQMSMDRSAQTLQGVQQGSTATTATDHAPQRLSRAVARPV